MRMLADDDDEVTTLVGASTPQQPAWMRTLLERCQEWLALLPHVCSIF
jgi:dynein heavy chain 1